MHVLHHRQLQHHAMALRNSVYALYRVWIAFASFGQVALVGIWKCLSSPSDIPIL